MTTRHARIEAAEAAIMGVVYVKASVISAIAKAVVDAVEAGQDVKAAYAVMGDNAEYPLLRKAARAAFKAAKAC